MPRNHQTKSFVASLTAIVCIVVAGCAQQAPAPINPVTKALIDDIRMFQIWLYGFENDKRKKALPGDFERASSTLQCAIACRDGNGNGVIEGRWDSLSAQDESFLLWSHLAAAGLRKAPTSWQSESFPDPYVPKNVLGGRIGLTGMREGQQPIAGMEGRFVGCTAGIPFAQVMEIEMLLDDGLPDQGPIRAVPDGSGPGTAAVSAAGDQRGNARTGKFTICFAW